MSTATAPSKSLISRLNEGPTYFVLRRLHSLTGIVFGGYLIIHLIVNATLIQAGDVFQRQVDKIHSLPFLPVLEWGLIYLPILYHTLYGVWMILTAQPNVASYPYHRNWTYLIQRITGVFLIFFLIYHVLSYKLGWFGTRQFDAHNAYRSVAQHMDVTGGVVPLIMYPLGVLAGAFHLANGFWGAGITWGLTVSAGAQRRWGYICTAIFVFALVAGLTALYAAARLDPAADFRFTH